MRDSVVAIGGLLLIVGCASHHVFVNPTRNAAEQQEDLADCTVKAEKQPFATQNPKRPPGVERRAQLATFVEDCMIGAQKVSAIGPPSIASIT